MLFKSLLVLTVCFVGLVLADNANETTTYETTAAHETTQQPNTTKTTTLAPTTTSNKTPVLNFNVTDSKGDVCLLLQFAVDMTIKYNTEDMKIASATVSIPAESTAMGVCNSTFNTITISFWNDWELVMNYTISGDKYELSLMSLKYRVDKQWFPNATSANLTAVASDLHDFSANKGSSYRCNAKTTVEFKSNVTFEITHYQGEPFYTKDSNKDVKFHTAVDCPADQTGTSKWVPIIVGSALAFLVLLVLIAYLIGRRKHRPGYQSV